MRALREILAGRREAPSPHEERNTCLFCNADLSASTTYKRYRLCGNCRYHYSLPASQRVAMLADPDTFHEMNRSMASLDPLSFAGPLRYRDRLAEAQRRTHLNEAVITGSGAIYGREVVLIVLDFGFMGGSMGSAVGEKVALAFEYATRHKLPVVAATSSSGARLQEGLLALMQQAKTAAVAKKHSEAGLPYVAVLGNPTTGSVYTSFASMADVTIAEPGALIGFSAMRVVEQTEGHSLPSGSHTAEFHLQHGMVDQIVERPQLKEALSTLLDLLTSRYRVVLSAPVARAKPRRKPGSAWEKVQLARHGGRPTAREYINRVTRAFIELRGDRLYGDDPAVVGGFGDIDGEAVVIVGQQREVSEGHVGTPAWIHPEGFRKAERLMRAAAKFKLPLITLIDTAGAHPGLESEQHGIGPAIAGCLATMSDLPVPTLAIVIGEGGSEGGLAFGLADRVLILENATYSVISPEHAASILYRTEQRAEDLATALHLTAADSLSLKVTDGIVPEPEGGAHTNHEEAARLLKLHLLSELSRVQRMGERKLLRERFDRYRHFGKYSKAFRSTYLRRLREFKENLAELPVRLRRQIGIPVNRTPSRPGEDEADNVLIP